MTGRRIAKKQLPPKALGKGDTVRVGDMMGTISGDHLSAGGMQGFFEVTFFVAYHGDDGLKVYVRRIQVSREKLTAVEVPLPADFDSTEDGDMSQAAGYIEYELGEP